VKGKGKAKEVVIDVDEEDEDGEVEVISVAPPLELKERFMQLIKGDAELYLRIIRYEVSHTSHARKRH
jgi:hypothetical protein